jgi:hypothetical protein
VWRPYGSTAPTHHLRYQQVPSHCSRSKAKAICIRRGQRVILIPRIARFRLIVEVMIPHPFRLCFQCLLRQRRRRFDVVDSDSIDTGALLVVMLRRKQSHHRNPDERNSTDHFPPRILQRTFRTRVSGKDKTQAQSEICTSPIRYYLIQVFFSRERRHLVDAKSPIIQSWIRLRLSLLMKWRRLRGLRLPKQRIFVK